VDESLKSTLIYGLLYLLKAELEAQMQEEASLNKRILENLEKVKIYD